MKKAILLVLLQTVWATGFSQTLSFKFGTPFSRADLDVRWNTPSNALPAQVRVYHLLPRQLPPGAISYLMALGSFTANDVVRSNANEMLLGSKDKSPDNLRSLWISFRFGTIEYQTPARTLTNLASHIPAVTQLPELTTNFLRKIGINIADVEKRPDGAPDFHFWEPFKEYFVDHRFITNIEFRAVNFRRSVDGASFVGNGAGGNCQIQFGEYGKPSQIRLSWRNLMPQKTYQTAEPKTIIKWIRAGKAVQGMVRMDAEPINWKTVKSVSVTKAELCYYAGDPFTPSDWLMPFAALWTTVDTGHGNIDVEIDSPIIDQTQAIEGKKN
jgi:hypothetical protein